MPNEWPTASIRGNWVAKFSQRQYVVNTNKISKDGVGSPLNWNIPCKFPTHFLQPSVFHVVEWPVSRVWQTVKPPAAVSDPLGALLPAVSLIQQHKLGT